MSLVRQKVSYFEQTLAHRASSTLHSGEPTPTSLNREPNRAKTQRSIPTPPRRATPPSTPTPPTRAKSPGCTRRLQSSPRMLLTRPALLLPSPPSMQPISGQGELPSPAQSPPTPQHQLPPPSLLLPLPLSQTSFQKLTLLAEENAALMAQVRIQLAKSRGEIDAGTDVKEDGDKDKGFESEAKIENEEIDFHQTRRRPRPHKRVRIEAGAKIIESTRNNLFDARLFNGLFKDMLGLSARGFLAKYLGMFGFREAREVIWKLDCGLGRKPMRVNPFVFIYENETPRQGSSRLFVIVALCRRKKTVEVFSNESVRFVLSEGPEWMDGPSYKAFQKIMEEFVWFQRLLLDDISVFQYAPTMGGSNRMICDQLEELCLLTMEMDEELSHEENQMEFFDLIK